LSAESPEDMIVWGNKLVADYSNLGMGVWSYDGSTWTELPVGNPEGMLGWGGFLVLDYGAGGVFLYDLTTWTQVTTMNPEGMAIAEFD
ncbi:MAG: hypothetical protein JRF65_13665, partial [Deltaproteobacteria bacterium]|nr:hypothetical protein [Deltaproteobacteria bacterium]